MISKADRFGGGASRIAEELCSLLASRGHTAHHYVGKAHAPQGFTRCVYGTWGMGRLVRGLNYGIRRVGLQEVVPWEFLVFWLLNRIDRYDVVHFHDLSTAVSPFTVRLVSHRVPTIWTFHDCAGFTGGCIFPMECRRFQRNCGECPQLNDWPLSFSRNIDLTSLVLRMKRKVLSEARIHVIAPSRWMAETAKSSGARIERVALIPYGIDTNLYRPLDKPAIRKTLRLPLDKRIVLLTAGDIADVRKGIGRSLHVLHTIRDDLSPVVLIVGKMDAEVRRQMSSLECREIGYLTDDRTKAQYFAAADVFLFCPIDDNLPLTVMETMATATPMVGFGTGGIPEMLEHKVSGYLAEKGDLDGVVRGLRLAFRGGRATEWGRAARSRVESAYGHEKFLDNHLRLFEEAISSFHGSRN